MFPKVGTPLAIIIVLAMLALILFAALFLLMRREPAVQEDLPVYEKSLVLAAAPRTS